MFESRSQLRFADVYVDGSRIDLVEAYNCDNSKVEEMKAFHFHFDEGIFCNVVVLSIHSFVRNDTIVLIDSFPPSRSTSRCISSAICSSR